jgi:cellulose synthase operon protein C
VALEPEPSFDSWPPRARPHQGPARVHLFSELAELERVPLRLRVSRGGLGVELCEPVGLGPVVMEHYEWALPELEYPLDLSGGVKQFVDHRGKLERARLRVPLAELKPTLIAAAEAILGPGVDGRIRALEDGPQVELLVSVWSEASALSFDLVLGSSIAPRLVVDQARGFGLGTTPLEASLHLLDALCRDATTSGVRLVRSGRCLGLVAGLDALSLELLPALGCRIPELGEPPVTEFSVVKGDLEITLSHGREPLALGRRGLRLLGLAEATELADQLLSQGRLEEARREYLRVLEESPGCPEILLEVGRIDWLLSGHPESARGYVEDARERIERVHGKDGLAPGLAALLSAFEGEIQLRSGRLEAARLALRAAAELEPDPSLAGFLFFAAARIDDHGPRFLDLDLLDLALSRAPHLCAARWARIEHLLSLPDVEANRFEAAARDVEYLAAMAPEPEARVPLLLRAASAFFAVGAKERALHWTEAALRLDSHNPEGQLLRAEVLLDGQQLARAIELLRSALGTFRAKAQNSFALLPVDQERMDKASVLLARAIAEYLGDYAEALRAVAGVDSRSVYALEARRLECEYARLLGERPVRLRAVEKVLQGFELGWFSEAPEDEGVERALLDHLLEQAPEFSPPDVLARLFAARRRLDNKSRSTAAEPALDLEISAEPPNRPNE